MSAQTGLVACLAGLTFSSALVSASTTPVRIEQTVEAQFPAALSFSSITSGEARVMINIDADGKLADLMVTGFTDPAFAAEAVGLLRQWRYKPVILETTDLKYAEAAVGALSQWRFTAHTRQGKPVTVRVQQQFIFPGDS